MNRLFLWLILSTVFIHCEDKTDWFPKSPELISLSETSGKEGETLVITGKHFSTTPTDNVVRFNDLAVTVVEATKTTLTIIVPAGEGQVMVRVVTKSLVAKKKLAFTYIEEIVVPIDPEEPGTIEDPVNPNNPDDPQNPGDPINPNDPQNPGNPETVEVTSISPSTSMAGTNITIVGKNFSTTANQNIVLFGNTPATVTAASATSLTVTVPAGTESVAVSVSVNGSTAVNKPAFTYIQPTVTNLSPNTAGAGASITITGTNFSSTKTQNIVLFGNTSATVTAASPTSLTVTVPAGTGSVAVSVSVNGSTAANKPTFTYLLPTVTNLSPNTAGAGASITITGTNFSSTKTQNTVLFGNTSATVTAASPTSLTVTVPAGTGSVAVSVSVNGSTAVNTPQFTYAQVPIVTNISPASGPNETTITINGQNFSTTLTENIVLINGTSVPVLTATTTKLTIKAPSIPVDYDHACPTEVEVSVRVYEQEAANKPIFEYNNLINPTLVVVAGAKFQSGYVDDTGSNARFSNPSNLATDDNGNLYLNDGGNIRKITPSGVVSTIVTNGDCADVDSQGNLYYVNGLELYKRTAGGTTTLISTLPNYITDLTVDNSGNTYVLSDDVYQIKKISPSGNISVLAGNVVPGSSDGQGSNAQFQFYGSISYDIEYDEANNLLYVVDVNGLRKITMTGFVTTTTVNWHESVFITAIAIDPSGNIYLNGNNENSCKLQPNGDCCGVVDTESYMAVNATGNIYFIHRDHKVIYKVSIP